MALQKAVCLRAHNQEIPGLILVLINSVKARLLIKVFALPNSPMYEKQLEALLRRVLSLDAWTVIEVGLDLLLKYKLVLLVDGPGVALLLLSFQVRINLRDIGQVGVTIFAV